jgi:hypothetical protein
LNQIGKIFQKEIFMPQETFEQETKNNWNNFLSFYTQLADLNLDLVKNMCENIGTFNHKLTTLKNHEDFFEAQKELTNGTMQQSIKYYQELPKILQNSTGSQAGKH